MPNELINYRINFKNQKGDDVYITIQDLKDYDAGDPTTAMVTEVALVGGAIPLEIETFNADGTVYGIFGKRAVISFKSTAEIGMHTFSEGEDGRFFVTVSLNTGNPVLFKGFVVMDDNEEQYVPAGTDVFISATDGLGLLRGVELTDFDGQRIDPDIPVTRAKLLAYALYKTGIGSQIIIQDNLYNGLMQYRAVGGGDELNNPWDQSWVLPITFEKEINVLEDCFIVIEKLLGKHLRLCWRNDVWWVQRVNELKLPTIAYTRFNTGGAAISGVMDDDTHLIDIGHADNHAVYFIARATKVKNRRPAKSDFVEYKFNLPLEIPRNKNFIRGDIISLTVDDGIMEYEIDDWRNTGSPLRPDLNNAPTNIARIWRLFENKYEKERYAVLTNSATKNYLISKEIYVTVDDKFTASVDWRWDRNKTAGGVITKTIYYVVLQAFDGTNWTMQKDGVWYQSNASWTINLKDIEEQWRPNEVNETEWRTTSVESEKIPRSGKLMFALVNQGDTLGDIDDVNVQFQNFQFTYIPFVNGSYKKYDGERITNTQPGRYSNPQENEVYLNPSQKFLFKGALLNYDSGSGAITLLSDRWFDWSMYHAGAPFSTIYPEVDKRLKVISLDHHNHYRNSQREFNFELRGLIADTGKHCDMNNVYRITVNNQNNKFKSFVLASMRQNWKTCAWTGMMVEIDDSRDQFAAVAAFKSEHKYIER